MFSPIKCLPVRAPSTVAPGHFAEKEGWDPGLAIYSFCDLGQTSLSEPHVPHLGDGVNYNVLSWQLGVLDNWPPGCFQNILRILLPWGLYSCCSLYLECSSSVHAPASHLRVTFPDRPV